MASEQNPLELERQIEASEGWKIIGKIQLLSITFHVFTGNHAQLKRLLDAYNRPEVAIPISSVGNKDKLDAFLREVTRNLHNYLASAVTLVEHSRTFSRELYGGTEFWKEYEIEIERRFRKSAIHNFVTDLRNYFLHNALPLTGATTHFEKDKELETYIFLDVASLKGWAGWSPLSKDYLNTLGKKVRLGDIVDRYATGVIDFYQWFGKRQEEIHRKELEKLRALQQKLRAIAGM